MWSCGLGFETHAWAWCGRGGVGGEPVGARPEAPSCRLGTHSCVRLWRASRAGVRPRWQLQLQERAVCQPGSQRPWAGCGVGFSVGSRVFSLLACRRLSPGPPWPQYATAASLCSVLRPAVPRPGHQSCWKKGPLWTSFELGHQQRSFPGEACPWVRPQRLWGPDSNP